MQTHKLHEELLRKTVEVLVVGCGGNGSAIVGGLPFLQQGNDRARASLWAACNRHGW